MPSERAADRPAPPHTDPLWFWLPRRDPDPAPLADPGTGPRPEAARAKIRAARTGHGADNAGHAAMLRRG